jgi:chromate transport protein ChrA
MQFLTRILPSFLVSWLLTFTLASLFHSQYVVNQLVNVGVIVGFNDRVNLILEDWLGLLPTYGAIIAVALAIAFLFTWFIAKKMNKQVTQLFVIAGVVAFATALIAIESIMNITIIAGARGWGFYAQLCAGAVGGYVFAKLIKENKHKAAHHGF